MFLHSTGEVEGKHVVPRRSSCLRPQDEPAPRFIRRWWRQALLHAYQDMEHTTRDETYVGLRLGYQVRGILVPDYFVGNWQ